MERNNTNFKLKVLKLKENNDTTSQIAYLKIWNSMIHIFSLKYFNNAEMKKKWQFEIQFGYFKLYSILILLTFIEYENSNSKTL